MLAKLPPPNSTDGNALAASAEKAVRALAQQRGITLPTAQAEDEQSSSKNRDRVVLAGGVILLCVLAFGARLLLGRRHRNADAA